MQRWLGILVLVALLAACTSGSSDPAPDATTTVPVATTSERVDPVGRVAVVLDPRLDVRVEAVRADLEALDPELAGGRTVRVEVAEDPSFVHDLTAFFAADGYELVCVLGPGAEAAVGEVAPRSPGTRFCAAPAGAEGDGFPDNVVPVDVRVEEVGYLAGVVLGTDLDTGPVAAVAGPDTTTRRGRLRAGLRAGLLSTGRQAPAVRVRSVAADEDEVADAVRALLERGVPGLLGMHHGDVVVEVAGQTDVAAPVPSPSPTAGPPPRAVPRRAGLVLRGPLAPDLSLPPQVLAVVEVHLHEAVALALRRHLEDWDPAPVSVGVTEDAIRAVPNGRARAGGVTAAVGDAMAALRAGDVVIDTTTSAPAPS